MENALENLGTLILIALYFAPTIVAFQRDHPSRDGIMVINLFLGWTIIGWIIALAWSGSVPVKRWRKRQED
jgi:hypothetical protein